MIFNITQGGSDPTLKKLIDGSISTIEIDGVEKIRDYAFYNCSAMTSVEIKNGVTTIGENAFSGCKFKDITIPPSINNIGSAAFNVTTLTKVNITDLAAWCNITFGTGDYANPLVRGKNLYINDELVTDLVIPDNVVSISDRTFFACTSLTSITIPDNVLSLGAYAFRACSNLTTAYIGNGLTSIGSNAFYACTKLSDVTVGSGLTTIGGSAFYKCTSLASIELPDSLTTIGGSAFSGCSGLTSITIPENVTSIDTTAFSGCTMLEEINFNATAANDFSSSNYVFYNAGKNGSGIKVTIGANVTKIPALFFLPHSSSTYAPNVTSVEFEEGSVCSVIGSSAFYYCKIPSITIPDSVTTIGGSAFSYCSTLKSVTIGTGVASIGTYAFSSAVVSLICKAITPPTLQSTSFNRVPSTCSFYVPLASIDAYKSATNWSARAAYIFPYVETEGELSSIDTTLYTKANVNGVVYNYDGSAWAAEE